MRWRLASIAAHALRGQGAHWKEEQHAAVFHGAARGLTTVAGDFVICHGFPHLAVRYVLLFSGAVEQKMDRVGGIQLTHQARARRIEFVESV